MPAKIVESEWNFRPIPSQQERDCLIWELARESATIRSEIEARKKRLGSYVLSIATNVKFSAESFYLRFNDLLDYFPQYAWRQVPEEIKAEVLSKLSMDMQLSSLGEQQAITFVEGPCIARPHLALLHARINLNYTNLAIQKEFMNWLANERKSAGIPNGLVTKFGERAQEGRGPKDKVRTDLKRLSIVRLMHVMRVEDAIKMEKRVARRAKEPDFFSKTSEIEGWRQARRKAEQILQQHFIGIPPGEKPLSFASFSEREEKS